jgi:xanthine dehydrogenase molybdopterin-binding subunit B
MQRRAWRREGIRESDGGGGFGGEEAEEEEAAAAAAAAGVVINSPRCDKERGGHMDQRMEGAGFCRFGLKYFFFLFDSAICAVERGER